MWKQLTRKVILLLLTFSFFPLGLKAQGFFISESISYKMYNGQPGDWEFVQDTNQFIYHGNDAAIIYDGVKWRNIHVGEYGRVNAFFLHKDGTVFTSGLTNYGYFGIDSVNKIKYYSVSDSLLKENDLVNEHHSIKFNDDWFYNFGNKGLDIFKSDTLIHYPIEQPGFGPSEFIGDRFYIFTHEGVYYLTDTLTYISASGFLKNALTSTTLKLSDDRVLLGSMREGLFRFDGFNFSKFESDANEYLKQHQIYSSILLNDSTLGLGTLSGGMVETDFQGIIKDIYTEEKGMLNNQVLSLFLDHEKTLWIGTMDGVQKVLTNQPIKHFNNHHGIDQTINFIELYNEFLVIKYIPSKFFLYNTEKNTTKSFINIDINQIIKNDSVLYLFANNAIYEKKSVNESSFPVFNGTVIVGIEDFDSDRVLALSDEGIIQVSGEQILVLDTLTTQTNFSRAIVKDSVFFFYNYDQFYQKNKRGYTQARVKKRSNLIINYNHLGLIDDELYLAAEGGGENGGLYKYEKELSMFIKADEFGALDPRLTTHQVVTFEQCENGDIWFFNDKEVKRIKNKNGKRVLMKSPYQLIGHEEGIYDIECGGSGDVWFGGVNGLYHLTEPDWDYKTDFKTNITGIYVNNDSLIYGGFGEPMRDIILPFRDNELRFTYAAASYIDETRNTYSVKLEGFDKDWSEWNLETQKDYTNIPEGDYIFKVRSRNVYEVDGREDRISFSVLPPWYRTWWAYILYLLTISGILYLAYKIRVNQLLKVERMRTKIASDLHDEVSATLTGISYFAEAVKKDRDQSRKDHFINLISESAGDAKEKITDIVWSINPDNDDFTNFLAKCRRYASDLLESKDLEYHLNIPKEYPGKLKMEYRQHIWMIFKEMITNAVRHSGATRLDVIMNIEDRVLGLVVQDNGSGFDSENGKPGNGVHNIRRRAKQINAEIELHSKPGFGTRWKMRVPLP